MVIVVNNIAWISFNELRIFRATTVILKLFFISRMFQFGIEKFNVDISNVMHLPMNSCRNVT